MPEFTPAGADHAIIPVMLGDAVVAQQFARDFRKKDLRDRVLLPGGKTKRSGAYPHPDVCGAPPEQIERAVEAFTRIGKQLGVIA